MPDKHIAFQKELERLQERYSVMPLTQRLKELGKLKEKKKRLEVTVNLTDTGILFLEHMRDIVEHRVVRDSVAMDVLRYLREGSSYEELLKKDVTGTVLSRVELLREAGAIEIDTQSGLNWPPVKVTERGMTLKYDHGGEYAR